MVNRLLTAGLTVSHTTFSILVKLAKGPQTTTSPKQPSTTKWEETPQNVPLAKQTQITTPEKEGAHQ